MRKKIHDQLPLVPAPIEHEHAEEVAAMSAILDGIPERLLDLVHGDLQRDVKSPGRGRSGLTADQVIRCVVLKQMTGYSYDKLAFHLADSSTYRTFCRLGIASRVPKKSTLQENIKRLQADTMEKLNLWLVEDAKALGIEKGRKVRVDSTVMESNIHKPTDNSLLWDLVRVVCCLMVSASSRIVCEFTDHSRRAKRRHIGIMNAKNDKDRTNLYRDLLKVARKTVRSAGRIALSLESNGDSDLSTPLLHYIELGQKVIDQTERRVLKGERVPAKEKIVSIFEPHTDIIVKDRRDTHYGHKINLTTGQSGLILDLVVEDGNPADATRAVAMIERQIDIYGRPPRQAAFDGGYASKGGLRDIKALGVKDVSFSKKRGLNVLDMVKSTWVYQQLKKFRAGIEAGISFIKRCFGFDRCTWRTLESFKAYAWSSAFSANLLILARHKMALASPG